MDGDPSISADGGGDHTQALGDNIRHNMEYKADKSNHSILISHPHQPTHVNVYVLLTGGKKPKKKKKTQPKCHHGLSAALTAAGKRHLRT